MNSANATNRWNLALATGLLWSGLLSAQVVDPAHPAEHVPKQEKLTTYCLNCHACENPTRDNPCLIGCPRHGGHFFGVHRVNEGPEIVIIDQLANLYQPVIFSHNLHASMSMMSGGCNNCHHYSEESGEIPPCRECHDASSNPTNLRQPGLKGAYHRQCINCHRDWGHENACEFCHEISESPRGKKPVVDKTDIIGISHPKITAVEKYVYDTSYKPGKIVTFHHQDHVGVFGLKCVDCHQGDNCSRCHREDGSTLQDKVAHTLGAGLDHVKTCGTCHAVENCEFCHSDQEKPAFTHAVSAGWALNEHHQDLKCQECHGPVKSFTAPSTVCTDCHIHWEVGAFDHQVTGLTLSETHVEFECAICHQDGFDTTPACDMCHDEDVVYPDFLPGWRDE